MCKLRLEKHLVWQQGSQVSMGGASGSAQGPTSLQPWGQHLCQEGLLDKEGSEGVRGEQLCPRVLGCIANSSYRWTGGEGSALWPRRGRAPPTLTPCEPGEPSSFPQGAAGVAPGRVSGDPWRGLAQRRVSRVGDGRSEGGITWSRLGPG